jgi:ParB family chromosome partitioning protein
MAKSSRKPALGKGLSAILNSAATDLEKVPETTADQLVGKVIELPIANIQPNPNQPRTHFDEERIQELAKSIQELGIIQPITVRKTGANLFEIVSGERRFRAAKAIGIATLPAYVRLANDQESLEMALVENIQRQDLDPIEIALSYERLIEEINLTQNQLSDRVGKKRSTVTNYLRLLKLNPIIQTGMRDGFISMGHGRTLVNVEDPEIQLKIYKKIIAKGLSVRATEAEVKKLKAPQKAVTATTTAPYAINVAESIATHLNTKVQVKTNALGQGSLRIEFESQQELNRIFNQITGEE